MVVQLMKTERLVGFMSKLNNLMKNRKYLPLYWLIIAFLVLRADYITGPLIQFPILSLQLHKKSEKNEVKSLRRPVDCGYKEIV